LGWKGWAGGEILPPFLCAVNAKPVQCYKRADPPTALDRLGFDCDDLREAGIIDVGAETFRLKQYRPRFVQVEGFAETPREPVGSSKRGRKLIGGGGNWEV